MNLGCYRLLAQRGAGKDGIAYRAEAGPAGRLAEVRVLSGARADAHRWPQLVKRLRLAALLKHPAAVQVLELGLDHEPAYVALEWAEGTSLGEVLAKGVPLPVPEAAALTRELASVLSLAHRLGLAHGRLGPGSLHQTRDPERSFKVDFTGLDTDVAGDGDRIAALDASCRAPESGSAESADPAADVYSLGALFFWLLTGRPVPGDANQLALPDTATPFAPLLSVMLAHDPADRPLARLVADRLAATSIPLDATNMFAESDASGALAETGAAPPALAEASAERGGRDRLLDHLGQSGASDGAPLPEQLGRYRLLDRVGQGGMGAVYRAEDLADGTVVAIKVLRPEWARQPEALRRFHKEARLLAEVNNPFVTNLLEVNEDAGLHYLVLEFVAGQSLGQLLRDRGRLDEPLALTILADVARALVEAHERGIVHRDVKPENVLLQIADCRLQNSDLSSQSAISNLQSAMAKLSDFGLARHVVESESLNLTQAGAVLGTPLYMAPEQCSGGAVDPRTDVYALGATLFHMLAGRPPFLADTPLAVIGMHCNDPVPPLQKFNPAVSDAVCQLVTKALAKSPAARHPHAGALLRELERVLRGEPTNLAVHPRLPVCDPARVLQYDFVWDLEASPRQLWPYVSDTERLNRAAGLSAVEFTTRVEDEGRVRRHGQFRKAGMAIAWEEHPFEWVEGRRMGVLREYTQGPFRWLVSVTELTPRAGGGTTLTHQVRLEPRNLLGRTVAAVQVGIASRRSLEHVYRRIDAFLTGKLGDRGLADPFEEPAPLAPARRQRLERLLGQLDEHRIDPAVVERLGEFLARAPAQEVARVRPLALARRLALDPEQVVAACLHGAREGLFVLLWDLLCPVCRIPSQVLDTLRQLREHGRCEACNLDFELDFANSVEMIFRAHPEIRDTSVGTYCVGGPAHSPHVVAQARVAAGERVELELSLAEGTYRLRGPQFPYVREFRVEPAAAACQWDLNLARPEREAARPLRSGGQMLALTNESDRELVVRVERTAPRDDALTAARASALALFRELFPGEVLSPGQLVSVATVTLLVSALDDAGWLYRELGDARAFGLLHEHFRRVEECLRREGGAVVKTVGEGVVAVFSEPAAAVRAGLQIADCRLQIERQVTDSASQSAICNLQSAIRPKVGIHRGPALAATLNDHLDYFGTTVNQAMHLPQQARGGELILTQAVAADPPVAALLRSRGLAGELVVLDWPGEPNGLLHRLAVPPENSA